MGAVWGWKDPMSAYYIADLNPRLRNPFFILVSRNPGAVAQRERIEEGAADRRLILSFVKNACETYVKAVDFIAQRARPTLIVSYERALRSPVATGVAIANFVGVMPPVDCDAWLESYIVPDRPDASLTRQPGVSRFARQFGSTTAVQALVEESLRVRHEGFDASSHVQESGIGAAGNRLYSAAVESLNRGACREAGDHALSILNLYSQYFPALFDGPIGVLAEELAGGGEEPTYPDLVCGAHYLLGMSSLLLASGQRALIYLTLAERMMKARLLRQLPGSVLSEANFWMCVFHKGVAAKAIHPQHVVDEVIHTISEAAAERASDTFAPLGNACLAEVQKRAVAELSVL